MYFSQLNAPVLRIELATLPSQRLEQRDLAVLVELHHQPEAMRIQQLEVMGILQHTAERTVVERTAPVTWRAVSVALCGG